jgi:hypothetical protein
MNATVNNGEDDPPFDVALRVLVQRHGVLRVLVGALRQATPRRVPVHTTLNAHLRRDVGLPPEDGP